MTTLSAERWLVEGPRSCTQVHAQELCLDASEWFVRFVNEVFENARIDSINGPEAIYRSLIS